MAWSCLPRAAAQRVAASVPACRNSRLEVISTIMLLNQAAGWSAWMLKAFPGLRTGSWPVGTRSCRGMPDRSSDHALSGRAREERRRPVSAARPTAPARPLIECPITEYHKPNEETRRMKFISGVVLGAVLSLGAWTLSAQNERAMHPRIAAAIASLKDARTYLAEAPHDFGGHKAAAIQATDNAIKQLNFALAYRGREDRK